MAAGRTYRNIFEETIGAGVRASLRRVAAGDGTIGEQDRRQAWHILSFGLACDKDWPDTCALLLTLAPLMEQVGYREEWMPYLQCGLDRAQQEGDRPAAGFCWLYIGHLRQRQHQFDAAEAAITRAVACFEEIGARQEHAAALNRLGELERDLRRYDRSNRHTDQALMLLSEEEHETARAYLTKGRVAFDRGDLDGAREHLATALRVFEAIDNPRGAAVSLQNLGRISTLSGDYASALRRYQRAAALLEEVRDPFNLAVVYMNMGIVHSLCDDPESALRAYAMAEPDLRRLRELNDLARLYNNQGIEFSNLRQWTQADTLFGRSLALWEQLDNPFEYANSLHSLGESTRQRGRHDDARAIFTQAIEYLQPRVATDRDRTLLELLHASHRQATEAQ